ncbi:sialidase family protein [Dyadobacter sp. 3J3]|uniref:sialidase family protein n=1 Tax=Dyadobacter sp. 3J3 TaxID=2606600 RepID=UPI00135805B3|nr:sialidase family protein [Dyadobacter sp. 3J3]
MKRISFLLCLFLFVASAYRFPDLMPEGEKGPFQISLPGADASGAYLTTDNNNNPVLSWVQQVSPDNYRMFYASSFDGGHTFEKARWITTSKGIYPHDENMSKIIYKKNGDMMAIFAVSNPGKENKYAGLLYYTQSFDNGLVWTEPKQLSPAKSYSNDERYFDMTLLPDGEVGVVWLDSRKPDVTTVTVHKHEGMDMSEGSAIYFSKTDHRKGFIEETRIAESACQCCRTKLFLDESGKLHLTYRAILNDSIRDMVHSVSLDNGKLFSAPGRISADNWVIRGCPYTGPTMTGNSAGMHFAWYTMGTGKGIFYCNSTGDKNFSTKESISSSASAKHPQIIANKKGKLTIVWDELNDEGNFRIGIQTRDVNGKLLKTGFLTPKTINAKHPVALPSGPNGILVAFTKKTGDQNQVFYDWKSLGE